MEVKIEDVLKIDVVLVGVGLLRTQESLDAFLASVGQEAVVEPVNAIPTPGIRIAFNRERISIVLSQGRSIIAKDYPALSELDQLADVATAAIAHSPISDERLQAIGFNVEIVYNQFSGSTASEYISERLLSTDVLNSDGWRLTVGASKTSSAQNGQTINQSVAPRFNDPTTTKIFASLNLHSPTDVLPTRPEILTSLQNAWKLLHEFPARFHEGVADG